MSKEFVYYPDKEDFDKACKEADDKRDDLLTSIRDELGEILSKTENHINIAEAFVISFSLISIIGEKLIEYCDSFPASESLKKLKEYALMFKKEYELYNDDSSKSFGDELVNELDDE